MNDPGLTRAPSARESDMFRLMADAAPVMIWVSGPDKRCTYFNRGWLDFTGRTLEQEAGDGWAEGVHPEDLARCLEIYTRQFDAREPFEMEYRLRRHDGAYRWLLDRGAPHFDERGEFTGFLGSCLDITERREVRERTGADRARIDALLNAATDAVISMDAAGVCTGWDGRAEAIFGWTRAEAVGRRVGELVVPPALREGHEAGLRRHRETGRGGALGRVVEMSAVRRDGTEFPVEISIRELMSENSPTQYCAYVRDISERARAERERRTQDEFIKSVSDIVPAMVAYWDRERVNRLANRAYADFFGKAPAEIVGKTMKELLTPEELAKNAGEIEAVYRGEDRTIMRRMRRHDGREIDVELSYLPDIQGGFIRGFVVMAVDLTARLEAERALLERDESLRRNESLHRHMLQTAASGYWLVDPEGGILETNEAYARMSGYGVAELTRMRISDLEAVENPDETARHIQRVKRDGYDRFTTRHRRKDGGEFDVEVRVSHLSEDGGRLVVFLDDITERLRADRALRASEQRLREIFDTEPECVKVVGPEGDLRDMNAAGVAMLEAGSLAEVCAHGLRRFVAPEHWSAFAGLHRRVMAGESGLLEFEIIGLRGTRRWMETHAAPLRDPERRVEAVLAITRDISRRKLAETTLRASEARFRDLVDATDGIVWEADAASFQFVSVSSNAVRILGYPVSDWLEPGFWADHVHPEDREKAIEYCVSCTGRLEAHDFEYRFLARDGRTIWLRDIVKVVAADGKPRWLRGLMIDITKQKAFEMSLQEERGRLAQILEGTQAGTWEWNVRTGEVQFNERWAAMLGYTLEELAPVSIKTWERLAHPEDLAESGVRLERHFKGESPYYDCECRMRHKSGEWIWVQDRGRLVARTPEGEPLLMYGTHLDISERKRADLALREHEQFLRTLTDALPAMVCHWDASLHCTFANRQYAEFFGRRPEAMRGIDCRELLGAELFEAVLPRMEAALFGEAQQFERTFRGATREIDGWIQYVPDVQDGRIIGFFVLISDITPLKRLQADVRQAEILSSLGRLVAGVAHEVRNPLHGLSTVMDAFDRRYGGDERFVRYLSNMRSECDRLKRLMSDLMEYGQPRPLELRVTTLEQPLHDALRHVDQLRMAGGVRIALDAEEFPPVRADAGRLEQVFINLLENAVQHTPNGREIRIAVRREDDAAVCVIRDGGPGLTPEALEHDRLFEPFYTRRHGGTGLGLSIVQRVVRDHCGSISARNHPEGGAEFTLQFPVEGADAHPAH